MTRTSYSSSLQKSWVWIALVEDVRYLPPLGKSDHLGLLMAIKHQHQTKAVEAVVKPNYNRGDYDAIRLDIQSYNWDNEQMNKGAEEVRLALKGCLTECTKKHIPMTGQKHIRIKKAPYLTYNALRKVHEKNRAWKQYIRTRNENTFREFCRV